MQWTRARFFMRCGRCGTEIKPGDAVALLVLTVATKTRCEACEGPAPPELPTRIEHANNPPPLEFKGFKHCSGLLPIDWRHQPTVEREREPGEDDA